MYDWCISDTHFFHENIIKYSGRPANHNSLMVANWNAVVKPEDTVLHLGDVLMGPKSMWQTLHRLYGKVYVLKTGNHDEDHKRAYLENEWGWKFIPEFSQQYGRWNVRFTHYPIENLAADEINIHGHIHNLPDPSDRHINVSVERINYRPIWIHDLISLRIRKLESSE